MGIFKRKGSPFYWAAYSIDGIRFRFSLQTSDKKVAEVIYAKRRSNDLLGISVGRQQKLTLDAALARYIDERTIDKVSGPQSGYYGMALLKKFGKHTFLERIDDNEIAKYVSARRKDKRWGDKPAKHRPKTQAGMPDKTISSATINREVSLLRAVINRARKVWKVEVRDIDWLQHVLPEGAGSDRVLSAVEAQKLLDCASDHLRPAIIAALFTGLRLQNVMALNWEEVDLDRRTVRVRIGKKGKPDGVPHTVPLADPLYETLVRLVPQKSGPVFMYDGHAVKHMRTAFRSALRRAGIKNFRWHDLRHTSASWMVDAGVPLDLVQKILAHSDIRLTMRYAHRRQGAQREAVEAIGSIWKPDTTMPKSSDPKKNVG